MHDLCDRRWHPGGELLQVPGWVRADLQDQLPDRLQVTVRRGPGQGLVEHDAERPDVGAVIEVLLAARLLGRHVEGRSEHGAGAREAAALGDGELVGLDLGDAEVQQLDDDVAVLALREEEVGRLDVPVHDARLVRLAQPHCRLHDHTQRQLGWHGPQAFQRLLQVLADEQLHDRVGAAGDGIDPGVQDLRDVLRLDRPAGHGLALEAADDLGVLRQGRPSDDLHGDPAPGALVPCLVDRTHAALAQLTE